MKAPTDKTNDTIQVVVTRSCDLYNCSNCTQLLPFRTDKLHMDPEVFRQALRSLKGWSGIRGVFGGNPCCHPQFPELMKILVEEVPNQRNRGIWTNNLMGHGELIRKVFYPNGRFNLNAHADEKAAAEIDRWLPHKLIPTSRDRASWHGPILLSWQDLGMTYEEWVQQRERCDINLTWSAAIFERDGAPYAYFCEVAGALDSVRGVNNGILATPGWWREKMPFFNDQVRNCCDKGCGVPLKRLGHLENENTYDYSTSFREAVENKLKPPKLNGELHEAGALGPGASSTTERPTDYQGLRSKKPK